ncbi:peptide chain release factor N(5)-glutamine methyltransferase [Candidatus Uhrbacteria bacterium]|nr:peptide chain release factor N(5)-glutamine methyltransferase [Candidatus Uhrbacteria bacterium]
MTLHEWLVEAEKKTEDAPWLASKTLGSSRTWIAANRHTVELTVGQRLALDELVARRLQDEPLAYILQSAPFYKRDFYVDPHVLIPRPETEDMIDLAKKTGPDAFIDIGTGSGAIAITLALETNRPVFASDISPDALDIAKRNAKHLGANVSFFKGFLLHYELIEAIKRYPSITICANLPYLPDSDKAIMPKSVTAYEPDLALFTGQDGNQLIIELLEQISSFCHSRAGGNPALNVFLECDPPQAKKLLDFSKSLFPDAEAEIIRDHCGRERFIVLSLQTPNHS